MWIFIEVKVSFTHYGETICCMKKLTQIYYI